MKAIDIFYFYRNCGYKIIPLYYSSKTPIFKNWNDDYDFEIIEIFLKTNKKPINFGILLGDIVDVEGDNVEANAVLDGILKDIQHPIYQSSKSKHHLFRNNNSKLTRLVSDGVEFRGHRHQSVIPPSVHSDGQKYKWITDIYRITDIPVLPPELCQKIASLKNKNVKNFAKKNLIKPGHMQTTCFTCSRNCFIHKKRFELEIQIFKSMNAKWSCHKCRNIDLRDSVRNLRAEKITKKQQYSV